MTRSNPIDTDDVLYPDEIAGYIGQLAEKAENREDFLQALIFATGNFLADNCPSLEVACAQTDIFNINVKSYLHRLDSDEVCCWNPL